MKLSWAKLAFPALLLVLMALPACRIGSGFDTAEKRRNLVWDDQPIQAANEQPGTVADTEPKKPEELPAEATQSPPIVYLLVAG